MNLLVCRIMVISRCLAGFTATGVIVLSGGQGVHEARAERQGHRICEEWRDYYFSVETGEFLGWVGEPYWYCYSWDDPVSQPENPAPDYYGGGVGFISGCRDAWQEAGAICLSRFDPCEEEAGGCR